MLSTLSTGDIIAGRFRVDREIAAGGMGRVYRARDNLTGRDVALKVLRGDGDQPSLDPRFERETAVLAELAHPAIVRYVAHGETPAGYPFLAMEWLEGEDLADRVRRGRDATTIDSGARRRPAPSGALTAAEIVVLARRIASGLGALHARGLVHRDVKPSNVFLPDGDVAKAKLLDFGLARLAVGEQALTATGIPIGTPLYMAPEQARGSRDIDARADVWALGCLLFECFTGATPFRGQHMMAILAKVLVDPAPRLSDLANGVPPEIDRLVARMLEKKPEARPRDGAEVEQALAEVDTSDLGSISTLAAGAASLGTTEQRVFSVLVAGAPTEGELAASMFDSALRVFAGRRESLADGSLLVLFEGARVAGDQAWRAARAAITIRSLLKTTPLAIATGRAEARAPHAVGSLIDRAVSTLKATTDARIRLDLATADLLEGRFDIVRDGPNLFLGGSSEHRARTLLGRPSPWVGREREIAMLEGVFAECVAEPIARVVLLTAPAGAGKSRLRHELVFRLTRREEAPEVFFAQGDSLGAGSPFVMIAPAIRRSAGILDGEALEVRREKIRARVARHVAPEERMRVAEFLGELAQAPFPDDDREALRAARLDPMLMGDAMRSAFETFLLAECGAGPVVLVLEDLHWGDLPSVKFVDAALRTLRDQPFFVLAVARPEVQQTFPGLWSERALIEVRLDALSRKASERLVRAVLGDAVPKETVDLVVERAEGNAFFLEEMIRAVATHDAPSKDGALDLPDTVLGTLQARLDALGAEAKRMLRAGSIFGEVFWRGGVDALLGQTRTTSSSSEWLDDLVAREIVMVRPTSRIPGEAELMFRHALVRDAAYAMLTDTDRALGHALAAAWLESRGELDALVLAEHWHRGQKPTHALGWFKKAAEQALEGNDLAAAIERAERAIACHATGEELGALRALQATACYWQSKYADAQRHGREAAALVAHGSATWFRSIGETIVASARRGEPAIVDDLLERALDVDAYTEARGAQIVCLCRGTFQLVFAGRFERAESLLDRIATLAGDLDAIAPAVAAQVHHLRGVYAAHLGHVGDFMAHLERAIASFEQAGDTRNVALERPTLGWCQAELGDFDRAETTLRAAVETCERMGVMQTKTYALVNLAYVLALRGKVHEARAMQTDAAERCQAQGNLRLEGWSRAHLSTLELGAGNVAEAEAQAEKAAAVLAASPGLRAWAEAALARAKLRRGDIDGALALSASAFETLRSLGSILQCESLVPLVRIEALGAAGKHAERDEVIVYARDRLRARAGRLEERFRAGFLGLPDNAATLA